MILMVNDNDREVARGNSWVISLEAGSLVSISIDLQCVDTSWGKLIGLRNELRGTTSMVPRVACITFLSQHVNGLCVVHYPTLGMVWIMPSILRNLRAISK